MEVKKQRSPHARTLHTDPADPSVPANWQTDAATWTTSFSNPIWFGVNYSSKYSTAPFLIPRRACCSALMNTMTESPYDVSITAAETQPAWCIRVRQRNAPVVPHQSEIGVFLMTATTNSILLKPHSLPCEGLARLRVHLYLNTTDKNELPVVVNWICRSTASSPQNVLCHKWIKLSLWCKNIQYTQWLARFQGNTALLMHFSPVIWRWEGFFFFLFLSFFGCAFGHVCLFEPLAFGPEFKGTNSAPSLTLYNTVCKMNDCEF